jgi:hypothetical protein
MSPEQERQRTLMIVTAIIYAKGGLLVQDAVADALKIEKAAHDIAYAGLKQLLNRA